MMRVFRNTGFATAEVRLSSLVRAILLILVLLAHGLVLLACRYYGLFDKGGQEAPGVLQVSWIESEQPKPPTDPAPAEKPKPLPTKPKPVAVKRPRAKPRPVLSVAADSPAPVSPSQTTPPSQDPKASPPEEAANQPKGPAATSTTLAGATPAVSTPSFDADYLSNPAPEYPAISRMLREEGRVTLRVHVTAEGKPDAIQLFRSSGHERLDQAASEVVLRWRFIPAKAGHENVAGWVIVPIRFSLRS